MGREQWVGSTEPEAYGTQGLTGFLSWLKDMLARRSTRSKLIHADAVALRRAIAEAEVST